MKTRERKPGTKGRRAGAPKGLRLRDARQGDSSAVFAFTRKTWGQYGDFIPRVWARWIGEKQGRLIVAELGGVAVGLAKVTDFGRGEIWLEGLRVDPRYRGAGIARAINVEVLRTLKKLKPRAVRYCTGAGNRASRHIGDKFGFRIATRRRYYWQKSRKGKLWGEFAGVADAREILEFMRRSKFLELSSGLVGHGWVFKELTPELLRGLVKTRNVMVARRSGRITGVAVYTYEVNDRSITLGFVDGDPEAIRRLARNAVYLAKMRGHEYSSISIPSRHYPKLVESGGFRRKDSMGQLVLEYADPEALRRGGAARGRRPANGRGRPKRRRLTGVRHG